MATHYKHVFEPIRIGKMEVKNRFVMAPMTPKFVNPDGSMTEQELNYYAERAKGGVGLIMYGFTAIDSLLGRGAVGLPVLESDEHIRGFGRVVEMAHLNGAKISVQLCHTGAQSAHPAQWAEKGLKPVSSSAVSIIRYPSTVGSDARALEIEEIKPLQQRFIDAAFRAKRAGFDAIDYCASHGHLGAQFMSPYFNKRTDRYGGDFNGRMRFIEEIIAGTRAKLGSDFPIICSISADEFIEGGIRIDEAIRIAQRLEMVGVDALRVTCGLNQSYHWVEPPMYVERGYLVDMAAQVKQSVGIPIIAEGRITTPELANSIVREGRADMVSLGRALVADPYLPRKAHEGRLNDIAMCIGINEGCVLPTRLGLQMRCAINAAVGREAEYQIRAARFPRRVMVVGAGPAGLEAARVLRLEGHEVIVIEQEDKVGGKIHLAAKPPRKSEVRNLYGYLRTQTTKLGVQFRLNTEFHVELLQEYSPEVVVVAVGAKNVLPELRGQALDKCVTAWDVLSGKAVVGDRTLIIGGGVDNVELSTFLADGKREVTLISEQGELAEDTDPYTRAHLLPFVNKLGIRHITGHTVDEITAAGVVLMDRQWRRKEVPADTVIFHVQARNNELSEALIGQVPEVYEIGDCVTPEGFRIMEAVQQGSYIARQIGNGPTVM